MKHLARKNQRPVFQSPEKTQVAQVPRRTIIDSCSFPKRIFFSFLKLSNLVGPSWPKCLTKGLKNRPQPLRRNCIRPVEP